MEREEARSTGHHYVDAEAVGLAELATSSRTSGELLAGVAQRLLDFSGLQPGVLLIAGSMPAGDVVEACAALGALGWHVRAGHLPLRRARLVKSAGELDEVRHAAKGTCAAFRAIAETLRSAAIGEGGELWLGGEPLTVQRLRGEIARVLATFGLEQPSGSIVAPGAEGAVPHNAGTAERRLLAEESLVVDLFPKGLLYADCTRTFCVGRAPEALARAHGAVLDALRWSLDQCEPGKRGWALQEGVCELLSAEGYPTPITEPGTLRGYVHGLGHGVGYELHELPHFRDLEDSDGELQEGAVVTLEPGLYDEAAGYAVRLEDLVVVGQPNEVLTDLPYALDPRAW
ncbi:MAG: M24 family metallopeptidase [Acidobacteriota bacterium]